MLGLRLFRYLCLVAAVVAIPLFSSGRLPVDHWCWQLCGYADGVHALQLSTAFLILGFLIWGLEKMAIGRAVFLRAPQAVLVLLAVPIGLLLHRMLDAYFYTAVRIFDPVGRGVNQVLAQFGGSGPFRRWSPDVLFNFKDYFRAPSDFYGTLGWALVLSLAFFLWMRSCARQTDNQASRPRAKKPVAILAIVLLGAGGTLFALAKAQQPLIELRIRCQELADAYDTARVAFTGGEIDLGAITATIEDRLAAVDGRACPTRLTGSIQKSSFATAVRNPANVQAVVMAVRGGHGSLDEADRLYEAWASGWPAQLAWQKRRGEVILALYRGGAGLDLGALLGSVTIVVEAFENLSTGAEHARVAEQFTGEVLSRLAASGGIEVSASRAAADAAGLDVTHVLKGSVRASGDRVRVTALLETADEGLYVWSRSFDRRPDATAQIQRDIVDQIFETLLTAGR